MRQARFTAGLILLGLGAVLFTAGATMGLTDRRAAPESEAAEVAVAPVDATRPPAPVTVPETPPPVAATTIEAPETPPPAAEPAPDSAVDRGEEARRVLSEFQQVWSLPNDEALVRIGELYADRVSYYGTDMARAAVMQDKRRFARRWPVRRYAADQITVDCDAEACTARATVHFVAESIDGARRSEGDADVETRIRDGRIISETSRVIGRQP